MADVKLNKANFIECPACTKELGERVVHHKSALREVEDLFDDTELVCPRGHTMPKVTT